MANFDKSEQSDVIYVNGEKMSLKAFRKQQRKSVKSKRMTNGIRNLPQELKYIMREIEVIKSLCAYYDNGYRQWGTKCRDYVLKLPQISLYFGLFKMRSHELNDIAQDIKKISKKGEKAVYQYVQKFAWKLEDVKSAMDSLYKAVCNSGVLEYFANYEFINGNKKRLGLKTLMVRTSIAIDKLDNIIGQITEISEQGVNTFSYKLEMSKWGDVI